MDTSFTETFWKNVVPMMDDRGCWEWIGFMDPFTHYGRFRNTGAHRVLYTSLIGPIPTGYVIDHLCRNRSCVNPRHLEAVTPRENNMRSESWSGRNARKSTCAYGHPLEPRPGNAPGRFCRVCALEHQRENRATGKYVRRDAEYRKWYWENVQKPRAQNDPEKRRAYALAYYHANKNKPGRKKYRAEYNAAYQAAHKDELRQKRIARYHAKKAGL